MKFSARNLTQERLPRRKPRSSRQCPNWHRIYLLIKEASLRQDLATLINHSKQFELAGGGSDWAGVGAIGFTLAVLDLDLEGQNGVALARAFKTKHPASKLVVVSDNDHSGYASDVLNAGADGYVLKDEGVEAVFSAIRDVAAGRFYLSEELLANNAGDAAVARSLNFAPAGTALGTAQN